MKGLLLDSHVLLWWAVDPNQLSDEVRFAIADGHQMVFVSAATIWELGIKQAKGKLDKLPGDVRTLMKDNRFEPLPISIDHAHMAPLLPPHHLDPFDRLLISQAQLEGLTLATRDESVMKYDVSTLAA